MYTGMNCPAMRCDARVPRPAESAMTWSRAGTRPRPRAAGVTLIELLVVITITGILVAVGIPSFKNITTSYRISGEINGLLGDMQYARAEAIKEGQSVTICVAANGACSGDTWQSGWIVFPNPTGALTAPSSAPSMLRYQAAFTGTDTFVDATNGTSSVTFNRDGLAIGLPAGNTLLTLHDPSSNVHYTRCLQITSVGAMQVVQNSTNGSCT